ncbi:oxidoreductase-like protein [Lentinula aff. detonsa]|nr:oxidoreductase-like protein [Lentinula aff. detonsa]
MFLKSLASQRLGSCSDIVKTARCHSSRSARPSQLTKQHSQRGGQNLSDRYIRLAKSLRGKETLEAEYENIHRSVLSGSNTGRLPAAGTGVVAYRGIIIPEKPKKPQSDECCMSGCAVCVYDLYEDSLTAYREAVAKVTGALKSMEVPEADWPRNLRTSERNKDVTLTVFEQMELEIQRRKQDKLDTNSGSARW